MQSSAYIDKKRTNDMKAKEEKETTRNKVVPPPTSITTEKVLAVAFPEMINTFESSSVNESNSSSFNSSSDGYSFESLFNGSTYYIDEYFSSIGYNGESSICSSSNNNNNECISTISGDFGCNSYLEDSNNTSCNTSSNDIESLYTSSYYSPSSSSSATTLNGLNIIHNDDALSLSSATTIRNNVTAPATLESVSTSDKKVPATTFSSSFRIKLLLLLERMFVLLLFLIIATGGATTTLAIIRHLRSSNNANSSSIVAAPGIITSNQTGIAAGSSINDTASDDERFFLIRSWVSQHYGDITYDPLPGTPQHDALTWMTYVDVPSLLGIDLTPRIPSTSNDTSEVVESLNWNENLSLRIKQRYALLLFFFNNIGTDNLMLGGWASLTGARLTECIWPGITCRTIAGATSTSEIYVVTGLELNPWIAHVHGTIPIEIGLLPYLESLILTDNSLTGEIPSELYTLEKLHTLRITNTLLTTSLSPDIGNLTDMQFFDVSNNLVHGSIPIEFALLTKLRYLNLAQNNFTGTIPTELGQLQLLENFFLEGNSFYGVMPSTICQLPLSHRLEELHADCVSPYYERIFCEPAKSRILCGCCTYCF